MVNYINCAIYKIEAGLPIGHKIINEMFKNNQKFIYRIIYRNIYIELYIEIQKAKAD